MRYKIESVQRVLVDSDGQKYRMHNGYINVTKKLSKSNVEKLFPNDWEQFVFDEEKSTVVDETPKEN